jgi:hypothetical protein
MDKMNLRLRKKSETEKNRTEIIKKYFIGNCLDRDENADKVVLEFIYDFYMSNVKTSDDYNVVIDTFSHGYCWYFAHMLQLAFECGEVCWCAPYGHFVWVKDGVPYDIDGVSISYPEHYIPERYIKEGLDDFKHVPGKVFNANEEYIQEAINKYLADKEKENGIQR